ncbi:DUF222 domain-containing protein [Geodermatophilus sp. SYSU D00815]
MAERSTEWPVFGPQTGPASGPLGAVQEADREIARWTAQRARALARYAASMPATADRARGEPGAMGAQRRARRPEVLEPVSAWTAQEVSIALSRSQGRAQVLLEQARTLELRLPGTLAALEAGLLSPEHLGPLLDHVAPIADDAVRAEVEAELLRWVADRAARRTITTPPQLGDRTRLVVKRRDARHAAQRALRAVREHGVHRQRERGEGLAPLPVVGTGPEIDALHAALGAHADALPDDPDDDRSRPRRMLDCLLDLVLRPGESDLPPVRVVLTVVAHLQTLLGGDRPGEVQGRVASAEEVRQLLLALTGAELGTAATAEPTGEPSLPDPTGEPSPDRLDERFLDDPGWEPWEYTPEMRAALAEWEAGWERRLEAGEFDDPDPVQVLRPVTVDDFDPEFERLLHELDDRWWADLEARLATDPAPGDDPAAR